MSNSEERTNRRNDALSDFRGHGRREFLQTTSLLSLGLLLSADPTRGDNAGSTALAAEKYRSNLYTPERRTAALENVQNYTWAADRRASAVETATEYLEAYSGLDGLWQAVTGQSVPRNVALSATAEGDRPLNDAGVYESFDEVPFEAESTRRPWELIDSTPGVERQDVTFATDEPWTVVEPSSGGVFPTNDFAAYRESGLDDRGVFDPDLADDSLLVNERRPDKPDDWGVDDGTGWVDEDGYLGVEGARYHFVAYFNRVYRWEQLLEALRAFRDAYLFTEDVEYARAGLVLLDRIADVYPEMDLSPYRYDDGYASVHQWTGQGKICGCVQETITVRVLVSAYDAFLPAMDDAELLAFLDERANEYDIGSKGTADDLRENVESKVVRTVLPAVRNHQIHSPSGGHRTALAMAGAVQNDPEGYTGDVLEFLLRPGERTHHDDGSYWGEWGVTGGNLRAELVDAVDRDGNAPGSPAAAERAYRALERVTTVLEEYKRDDGPGLADHPKLERAAAGRLPQVLREAYLPSIGAMGRTGVPWLPIETEAMTTALESFGDGQFAKGAFLANGYGYDGVHGSIFSPDPAGTAEAVREVIDADGPLELSSTNQAGTGFAALRDGEHYIRGGYRVVDQFPSMTVLERTTDYTVYSNSGTVQFEADTAGQSISFQFSIPVAETYEFSLKPFRSSGYGTYDVLIDGERIAEYDFYDEVTGAKEFTVLADEVDLSRGEHRITFENTGKRPAATNYKMGVIECKFLDERAQREEELEAERGNTQRSFALRYGASTPDGEGSDRSYRDALHLDVHAYGGDLAPALGYPEHTGFWPDPDSPGESPAWPKGRHWTSNTISHNTVVVDESPQSETEGGSPHHFRETERVRLADIDSTDAYPTTSQYRRTTAMVRIDDHHSYAVDFFRIVGGDDHRFSFHGAAGSATTSGLDLEAQDVGTYARPDVPRPAYSEESAYERAVGNGFDYLDDVVRDDDPADRFSVDWEVTDAPGIVPDEGDAHLRLTMVGDVDEVALADGRPPRHTGNPWSLRYALARRWGSNLETTFTSVIEPYRGSRNVESIEPVPAHSNDGVARAVQVTLTNGRTDYVAYAPGDSTCRVGDVFRFDGFLAVYSEREGTAESAFLEDGSMLAPTRDGPPLIRDQPDAFEGRVEDLTREPSRTNEIQVRLTSEHRPDAADDLVGEWLYVETGTGVEAYRIEGATSDQANQLSLDIGDATTVEGYVDQSNPDAGYEYTIETGAPLRIPLSHTWERTD
ncbi:heparinase II/III family protein [Natronosalvus rutilus]|uniref:Heparinase II/III family protein n=1 Tax=Natronosalvus rutilus TaxID=2953753 RepID=A0A9E7N8U8_9EURY|nr:heparinase II/III family protein [Natronosalvus rutilus]UTF52488.1 heparinase II/III family protein [Natronosalvus rutilus]